MPETSSSGSFGIVDSQEHLDDLRVMRRVGELALEDAMAGIHDDDAVGDLADEAHEMLDHEQRDARMRERLEALRDMLDLGRIEPGGKLVDEEQPRAGGESA